MTPTLTQMNGFTKLFGSIITSTIWREDDKTRLVWITMLALADRLGNVPASVPGLAALSNVSIEDCKKALETLSSPDEYSRTKAFEGRRIQEIEGGWHVINYVKYREIAKAVDRTEYLRLKKREERSKGGGVELGVGEMSTDVNKVSTNASASASASLGSTGGTGGESEVEFPVGFPKTEEEAAGFSQNIGCSPEFAKKVWMAAVGRGCRDSKDVLIRSFHHFLATQHGYALERAVKEKSGGGIRPQVNGARIVVLNDELKRLEAKVASMNRERDTWQHLPENLKKPWAATQAKIKEVRTELGLP